MSLFETYLPNDISSADFQHFDEPTRGDARSFRVSLQCHDETMTPAGPSKFDLAYAITSTDWDPAMRDGRLVELVDDRRQRAEQALLGLIRREMRESKSRIVRVGARLVRQRSSSTNLDDRP